MTKLSKCLGTFEHYSTSVHDWTTLHHAIKSTPPFSSGCLLRFHSSHISPQFVSLRVQFCPFIALLSSRRCSSDRIPFFSLLSTKQFQAGLYTDLRGWGTGASLDGFGSAIPQCSPIPWISGIIRRRRNYLSGTYTGTGVLCVIQQGTRGKRTSCHCSNSSKLRELVDLRLRLQPSSFHPAVSVGFAQSHCVPFLGWQDQ